MDILPNELVDHIGSFLPLNDWSNFSQTTKRHHYACSASYRNRLDDNYQLFRIFRTSPIRDAIVKKNVDMLCRVSQFEQDVDWTDALRMSLLFHARECVCWIETHQKENISNYELMIKYCYNNPYELDRFHRRGYRGDYVLVCNAIISNSLCVLRRLYAKFVEEGIYFDNKQKTTDMVFKSLECLDDYGRINDTTLDWLIRHRLIYIEQRLLEKALIFNDWPIADTLYAHNCKVSIFNPDLLTDSSICDWLYGSYHDELMDTFDAFRGHF